MKNKYQKRIKALFAREVQNILYKRDNVYILYNIYSIEKINNLWEVTRYNQYVYSFLSSMAAISWCVADNLIDVENSTNILVVDIKLQNKKNDIVLLKSMLRELTLDEFRSNVLLSRMSNDLYMYNSLKNEIIKLTNKYKYIQIKGFQSNERKRPNTKYNRKAN